MPLNIEVYEELNNHKYIRMGLCSYCGSCIAVCPTASLRSSIEDLDKPSIVEDLCINCGLCILSCPQLNIPASLVVGEPVVKAAYTGRTLIPEVRKVAQDGGIASSLLLYSLREGIIDAGIVAGRDEEWRPRPVLANSPEAIIETAGSKYLYAVNLLELLRAVINDPTYRSIGVVGVPCMARSIWKMNWLGLRRFTEKIRLIVGLFCTHNFTYTRLNEIIRSLGAEPGEVTWMGIKKGNMMFKLRSGEIKSIPVKVTETPEYLNPACLQCPEFLAEKSDISVGSIGSEEGWNSIIVHTDRGLEILRKAEENGFIELKPLPEKSMKIIMKFVKKKKKHALKYISELYGLSEAEIRDIALREDFSKHPTKEELGLP